MFPVVIKLGPLTVYSYGLMLATGFLTAMYFAKRDYARMGISSDTVSDVAFWGLLLGLAGTRVFHIILYPEAYSWTDPVGWFAIWRGGLVFQGAVPPCIVFFYIYLRRKGIAFWPFADVACVHLPLGHAIGRLGCFLRGCCYGERTDIPVAVRFPRVPWDTALDPIGSDPYLDHCLRYNVSFLDHWSLPIHPTQLYSAVGLFCIFAVLKLARVKWKPFPGFVLPLYLVLYGVKRFIVEFFRGDHNPTHFGDALTDQQVFSVLSVLIGVVLFIYLRKMHLRLYGQTGAKSD